MFAFAKSLPVFTGPMPRVWRSAISSSRRVSTESSERWDMFAAICVERPPLVAPKLNILEQSVKEALEQYELARSLKSDHEMRLIRDQERAERVAAGQKMAEEDIQESSVQSAQDFEDKSNKELKQFHEFQSANPIIPITDRHSSNRFLEQNVILVCQQKVNQDLVWRLPEQKLQENENLRQAADRCLELFGQSTLNVKVLGNCPFAVLKYKYPKPISSKLNSIGKHIYYFKAQLKDGEVQLNQLNKQLVSDFAWLTRNECRQQFKKKYWQTISSGLLIEGPHEKTLDNVLKRIHRKLNQFEQEKSVQQAI